AADVATLTPGVEIEGQEKLTCRLVVCRSWHIPQDECRDYTDIFNFGSQAGSGIRLTNSRRAP
ncbi:hypothetical protein, partial [Tropicimonas marinistellae]|uniref:hypothetical protein n=1 Tax=Tropicimonas marinistellae TaxID=1739787 RepID=UPI001F39B9FE